MGSDEVMAEKKAQIRVYLPTDIDKVLKILAAVKESSVNAIVNEAIEHWLEENDQQEIIQRLNLDTLDEL
ncbi:MAG: hypothetical protein HY785_00370 [Oscillatoriophycideae cyanobacterium NC_groundwater_1537_Pr4_S-0.65um_50_18]|jgi:predicted transcriptional regulator|nr:hypothetical protein [Oscillatoriophycideae cyanobacterium NC_groundwater_1537_Pr4_S-0.65um_50_18]